MIHLKKIDDRKQDKILKGGLAIQQHPLQVSDPKPSRLGSLNWGNYCSNETGSQSNSRGDHLVMDITSLLPGITSYHLPLFHPYLLISYWYYTYIFAENTVYTVLGTTLYWELWSRQHDKQAIFKQLHQVVIAIPKHAKELLRLSRNCTNQSVLSKIILIHRILLH